MPVENLLPILEGRAPSIQESTRARTSTNEDANHISVLTLAIDGMDQAMFERSCNDPNSARFVLSSKLA